MSAGAEGRGAPGANSPGGPRHAAERVRAVAATAMAAEADRWPLWGPVLVGTGIGVYFSLLREPPLWLGGLIAAIAGIAAVMARRRAALLVACLALAAVGAGLGIAQWRAHAVAAPVLEKRWGPADLAGRVVSVEARDGGRRVVLDQVELAGVPAERTPARVRIRIPRESDLVPGSWVAGRAVLMPPPAPAAPGAYDFQRHAWFERLGGVGYAVGPFSPRADAPHEPGDVRIALNAARQQVVERVLAGLPGSAGAVAAALMTGEQGALPAEVMEWMRDSGLAHLLSVSGLHVGLVAAIVFVVVRRSLALIPSVALRWPIKKWAAVVAFVVITLYMLFVMPSVPTERAWLMTSVVLFAVLIDRTAISMRLAAWAAFVVLLVAPESLLTPSFQMSFAAVVALIAAWEVAREPIAQRRSRAGPVGRLLLALGAVGLTTLVASAATAPYALYHFNRFAAFGLAANLVAVPLTSLWIMPWALIAFALMPFGLESVALAPMGWGIDAMLAVAQAVAGADGAAVAVPAMPAWGLVIATFGGLWLCLWRTRLRLLGLLLIALGIATIGLQRGPDILVSGDAQLLAVRGADGELQISSAQGNRIVRESWLRREGQDDDEVPRIWPRQGRSADGRLVCDPSSCLYTAEGQVVALVRKTAALAEDCAHADVVIATVPVRVPCPAHTVIDRFALWRDGGHAVWLEVDGRARVLNVRAARGERPWVPPVPRPRNRDQDED